MKNPEYSYPIPPPIAGWSWVYGEVVKGDHFKPWSKKSWEVNPVDIGTETEGPSMWFSDGDEYFRLSGFIRRNTK